MTTLAVVLSLSPVIPKSSSRLLPSVASNPLILVCLLIGFLKIVDRGDMPHPPANVTVRVDAPPLSICLDHRDLNCRSQRPKSPLSHAFP